MACRYPAEEEDDGKLGTVLWQLELQKEDFVRNPSNDKASKMIQFIADEVQPRLLNHVFGYGGTEPFTFVRYMNSIKTAMSTNEEVENYIDAFLALRSVVVEHNHYAHSGYRIIQVNDSLLAVIDTRTHDLVSPPIKKMNI
jgi:hypothetical protein